MPRQPLPGAFLTGLASLPDHHIAAECACSHTALIPVAPVLERLGPTATVRDLLDRVRCSWCGARQIVGARIVYVGGSGAAMASADNTSVHLPAPKHP